MLLQFHQAFSFFLVLFTLVTLGSNGSEAGEKSAENQVQLKELCFIGDGWVANYRTPLNLSLERSGRSLMALKKRGESALFRAPDCKIIGRYKKVNFENSEVSLNGSGLYARNRGLGSKGIHEIYGIEKTDGTRIPLAPPESYDDRSADFPRITLDGNAVVWRRYINKEPSYRIQSLQGELLAEIRFPLGGLDKSAKILMVDMRGRKLWVHKRKQGIAVYDLKGKQVERPVRIPEVKFFSSRQTAKIFQGKKRNWVAWDPQNIGVTDEEAHVVWQTDFGRGRVKFKPRHPLDRVAVSGDGRYIAVTYRGLRDRLTGDQDHVLTLISTASGKRVWTRKLGRANPSGEVNQVVFLKTRYLAFNRLKREQIWLKPEGVVLYEIKDK